MSDIKLVYFDIRGRGELIRWVLHAARQQFTDERVAWDPEKWFSEQKAKTPYGQLPYLEIGGKTLAQSVTIARFLASRFKLAGRDEWEQAKADELVDFVQDAEAGYHDRVAALYQEKHEESAKLKEEYNTKGVHPFLKKLEQRIITAPSGFFITDQPTWADLAVGVFLDCLVESAPKDILQPYPGLTEFNKRVRGLPGLREWLSVRPSSEH